MPTPLILSYAKRSRRSVDFVEKAWDRAKEQAKAIRRSDVIDRDYWKLVNGIVKKELGLNESLTFKTFLNDSIFEMSTADIDGATRFIKQKFYTIDIIVNFTKHFGDRLEDGATDKEGTKRDNISVEEMIDTFAKLYSHHKRIFKEAHDYNDEIKRGEFEGVIRNVMKKINVPFALEFNKSKGKYVMTCKTIMKRDDFIAKPKDHVVEV